MGNKTTINKSILIKLRECGVGLPYSATLCKLKLRRDSPEFKINFVKIDNYTDTYLGD